MSHFTNRHIGPTSSEKKQMIDALGVSSIADLIDKTVPSQIRMSADLNIPEALTEQEFINHMLEKAELNIVNKSFIGLGYHETITPSVILRNILENPG